MIVAALWAMRRGLPPVGCGLAGTFVLMRPIKCSHSIRESGCTLSLHLLKVNTMKCDEGSHKEPLAQVRGPGLLISQSDVRAFLSARLECCSFIPVALREVHIDPDVLVLIQMIWYHIWLSCLFFFSPFNRLRKWSCLVCRTLCPSEDEDVVQVERPLQSNGNILGFVC